MVAEYTLYDNRDKLDLQFYSYEQLLNYLVSYASNHNGVDITQYIRMVDTDKLVLNTNEYGEKLEEIKPIIIVDKYDRIVSCPQLKDDMQAWKYSKELDYIWYRQRIENENIERWRLKYFKNKKKEVYPEFRRGPWPRYHRFNFSSFAKMLKRMKTTAEKRETTGEYREYHRAKRKNNLPTNWDDVYRSRLRCRSWKDQNRNRHQWEHRINTKKNSRVYLCKGGINNDEYCEQIFN